MIDASNSAVLFHPTVIVFSFTQHLYDISLSSIYHVSSTRRIQAAVTSGAYGKNTGVLNIIERDPLL